MSNSRIFYVNDADHESQLSRAVSLRSNVGRRVGNRRFARRDRGEVVEILFERMKRVINARFKVRG